MTLGDDLLALELVRGVAVAVQEHHGHRSDSCCDELVNRLPDRVQVDRRERMAVRRHPFHNLEPVPAGDERWWAVVLQVVHRRTVCSPDLVNVAETFGGEEPDRRVPTLEQRVQTCGRAMDEEFHLGPGFDGAIQHLENSCGEVPWSRERFCGGQLAIARGRDEVRESAANVNRDPAPSH